MTTPLFLLLAIWVAAVSAQNNRTVGQTVQTSSGPVRGHAASPLANVSEYLGIPYAQPPLGALRFVPPVSITSGNKPIDATTFGFSCHSSQILYSVAANATGITPAGRKIFDEWDQLGDSFSEDCLTLNIWTKPQIGEEKKAVLVWLYGGGFFTGSTSVPLYNGQTFTDEQDVVVVSVNYRLNIFGFPGSPATHQNLGLLDIRMAIQWISQNIAGFGGDPDRIVLFGQSAGAVAADMLSYAFPQDPTVKGLILQSGSAAVFKLLGETDELEAAGFWSTAAETLGCTGDDANILACMRGKPAVDLINAQLSLTDNTESQIPTAPFVPTIDNITVFSDYKTRNNFSKIPILIGNNDNELGITQALATANTGVNTTTAASASTADEEDTFFTCPVAHRANISIANNLPTWRYHWFGSFPNTQLLTDVDSGAWHGSELGVLFGTNQAAVPNTPEENAVGALLRGIWAAFAKDPSSGLDGYMGGVPRYDPGGNTLIRLGLNNSVGLNLVMGNAYDANCS